MAACIILSVPYADRWWYLFPEYPEHRAPLFPAIKCGTKRPAEKTSQSAVELAHSSFVSLALPVNHAPCAAEQHVKPLRFPAHLNGRTASGKMRGLREILAQPLQQCRGRTISCPPGEKQSPDRSETPV